MRAWMLLAFWLACIGAALTVGVMHYHQPAAYHAAPFECRYWALRGRFIIPNKDARGAQFEGWESCSPWPILAQTARPCELVPLGFEDFYAHPSTTYRSISCYDNYAWVEAA